MGNSSSTTDDVHDENDNENNGDYPHPIDDSNHNNINNNNNVMMDDDPFDGSETLGYRVLGVQPNSPASAAGLVSFLDFLVGANGQLLLGSGEDLQEGQEYNDVDLPAFLMEHKNVEVEFLVFNIKSQKERLVYLTPSDTWGGAGLLGVTIRLDDYAMAEERIIRVLSVDQPHSPAAVAGLVPERDYILGTTQVSLDKTDTLAALLHQHQDQVLELYVYNADSDLVRTVALMPTLSWGGRGLLGADVGMGYLHRLPSSVRSTDGASVERKVRYVAVGGNKKMTTTTEAPVMTGIFATTATTTTATISSDDATAQEEKATSIKPPQQQQQQQGIFEHEPQLEMEPPDHEEEEEEEASPPQVSPVASAEAAESTNKAAAAAATTTTTVKEVLPPPPKASAAAAASIAAAVFSQYPPAPAAVVAAAATAAAPNKNIIGTAPKSPPLIAPPPNKPSDAAAAAAAAAGLPPPPVLNYDTPPSVKASG